MITESEMYWITRLDNIRALIATLCVMSGLLVVVLAFAGGILRDDNDIGTSQYTLGRRLHSPGIPACMVLSLLFGTALVFVPTIKEYAAIRVIPAIANSEAIQQDIPELYKLSVQWMKQELGAKVGVPGGTKQEEVK